MHEAAAKQTFQTVLFRDANSVFPDVAGSQGCLLLLIVFGCKELLEPLYLVLPEVTSGKTDPNRS